MTNPVVLVERRERVMIITLNRPEARNAVNVEVTMAVGAAMEAADQDPDCWVVILTGAGDKAFCAGADLKAMASGRRNVAADPKVQAWGFAGYVTHHISKPTIAAVNGMAIGGGVELTLASDLAIAADVAVFGLPEVKRGILAGAGGTFRMGQQVPPKFAMELLLTGDSITAQRALELGLVNAVVPQADVLDAALALAARITVNAPLAVQAAKRMARGIVDGTLPAEEDLWRRSKKEGAALMASEDGREGPRAFAEKRPPVWKAR